MPNERELHNLRQARANKKLRLFLCTDNPVWEPLARLDMLAKGALAAPRRKGVRKLPSPRANTEAKPDYLVTACLRLLGLSGEWRRRHLAGHIPAPESLVQRIEGLQRRLAKFESAARADSKLMLDEVSRSLDVQQCISDFLASYRSGDSVYSAGRALTLVVDDCQIALDRIIYAHKPFMTALFFDNTDIGQAAAAEALEQLGGVYYAYMRRREGGSGSDTLFLKSALRVRYVLKLDGGHGLRIKLNLPHVDPTPYAIEQARALHGELPLIEYDGFLFPREHCHWVLQERTSRASGDLISMITTITGDKGVGLRGHYLTVGQDPAHAIVHDDVVIQRIPEELFGGADAEQRGKIMRTSVRTIRRGDKDYAAVSKLFPREGVAERRPGADRT